MAKLADMLPKWGGQRGSERRIERRKKPRSKPSRALGEGFWERPDLMNLVSDLLFVCSSVILIYAAILEVVRLPFFPLQKLVVVTAPEQVTATQIEYATRSSLAGNFFTVNLDGVRTSFEKLPWVRKASVRRRWPNGIDVAIEEHVAVARWQNSADETRLVNHHGEVFSASLAGAQNLLPLFGGPEGSAPQLLARYYEFRDALATLQRKPQMLTLSAREAWQLRLDDGVVLDLGRDQAKHPLSERLQRFVETYSAVQARVKTQIAVIDMRYPNGFALRTGRVTAQALAKSSEGSIQNTSKGNT